MFPEKDDNVLSLALLIGGLLISLLTLKEAETLLLFSVGGEEREAL